MRNKANRLEEEELFVTLVHERKGISVTQLYWVALKSILGQRSVMPHL